jgi:hypothetical protein
VYACISLFLAIDSSLLCCCKAFGEYCIHYIPDELTFFIYLFSHYYLQPYGYGEFLRKQLGLEHYTEVLLGSVPAQVLCSGARNPIFSLLEIHLTLSNPSTLFTYRLPCQVPPYPPPFPFYFLSCFSFFCSYFYLCFLPITPLTALCFLLPLSALHEHPYR